MSKEEMQKVIEAFKCGWLTMSYDDNQVVDVRNEILKVISAKDALIKKLADALKKIDDACDGDMCKHFIENEHCSKCKYFETCQTGIAHNALKTNESEIAKAVGVCNA